MRRVTTSTPVSPSPLPPAAPLPPGVRSSGRWSMVMPAVTPAVGGPQRASSAPGSSPFHTKGLFYLGVREHLDRVLRGGYQAVLEAIARDDAAAARFLEGPFTAGSLYDVLPAVTLLAAAARLRGVTAGRLTREIAAHLASRDLRTVYKAILAQPDLESVALRLPELTTRYFDFGAVAVKKTGAQTVVANRTGVPDVVAPLLSAFVEGFTPVALALAGAVDVRITLAEVRFESMAARHPTVRLEYTTSWT